MKSTVTVVYDNNHIHHSPFAKNKTALDDEYPDQPIRVETILEELKKSTFCTITSPEKFDKTILDHVHRADYLQFLQSLEELIPDTEYYYQSDLRDTPLGMYSFDLSAPVSKDIYKHSLVSAGCAWSASEFVRKGAKVAFSLSRPPGHHAMKSSMGGFCYLNNTAIAAHNLSQSGKVAVLDIDYHHGNGTQDIFYHRSDVFTTSIHADPATDYPYRWGYADETGEGSGLGYNVNFPLKRGTDVSAYNATLEQALEKIKKFKPKYLVVALGLDTYEKDPLGTFKLTTKYYEKMGESIHELKLPTVVTLEGGYFIKDLGENTISFLEGFM